RSDTKREVHVAADHETGCGEALMECADDRIVWSRGAAAQETDHRQHLLRAAGMHQEWCGKGHAAKPCDQLPPLHLDRLVGTGIPNPAHRASIRSAQTAAR